MSRKLVIIDVSGQVPLHVAIRTSFDDVILAMITAGADVNIANSNGTRLYSRSI